MVYVCQVDTLTKLVNFFYPDNSMQRAQSLEEVGARGGPPNTPRDWQIQVNAPAYSMNEKRTLTVRLWSERTLPTWSCTMCLCKNSTSITSLVVAL